MKKNRMTYSFLVLALILAFTVGAKDATAVYIDGTLDLTGQVTPVDSSWASTTLSTATGLSFKNVRVSDAIGDYSSIVSPGTSVKYNDFQFDAFSVRPLWEIETTGAEFRLTSLTIELQTDTSILLSGWGIIELSGYGDTSAYWTYSGSRNGQGSFSFSNNTTGVPEPGTLSLLGIGMVVLIGGVVRNRKIKKEKVDT